MFKFTPNPTFTAPVLLSVPGEPKPQSVEFVFKHATKTQLSAIFANVADKKDHELICEIVDGWDVKDADGKLVPFNESNVEKLLENYPAASFEIFLSFKNELTQAKSKN